MLPDLTILQGGRVAHALLRLTSATCLGGWMGERRRGRGVARANCGIMIYTPWQENINTRRETGGPQGAPAALVYTNSNT